MTALLVERMRSVSVSRRTIAAAAEGGVFFVTLIPAISRGLAQRKHLLGYLDIATTVSATADFISHSKIKDKCRGECGQFLDFAPSVVMMMVNYL